MRYLTDIFLVNINMGLIQPLRTLDPVPNLYRVHFVPGSKVYVPPC